MDLIGDFIHCVVIIYKKHWTADLNCRYAHNLIERFFWIVANWINCDQKTSMSHNKTILILWCQCFWSVKANIWGQGALEIVLELKCWACNAGFFWDQDFEIISVSNTAQCRMTGRTVWLAFAWLMLVTSPLSKLSPTYSWIDADGFQQHRVDWLLECCFANQCFPKLWGACSFTIILQCDLQ